MCMENGNVNGRNIFQLLDQFKKNLSAEKFDIKSCFMNLLVSMKKNFISFFLI